MLARLDIDGTGEKARFADFIIKHANFELNNSFIQLKEHINKVKDVDLNSGILETKCLCDDFLAKVSRYEHVLALSVAYNKDRENKP